MFLLFCIVSLASGTITVGVMLNQPKIAYVNSSSLMEGYHGMKESKQLLEQRKTAQKTQLDSLANVVDNLIQNYRTNAQALDAAAKQQTEALIARYQNDYFKLKEHQEAALSQYEDELVGGLLTQMNSYIDAHGEAHGYDIIIGTSGEGNVLYAKQYYDITADLVADLNNSYQGS